ncbi:3-isopropylmalate dehydratase large subunit [Buchnera aphidicola]|uniref:3-isopropylmalate dehydratase large subunit n=1 Tax=Buchnera aphidicola TaxID=9 RepID=UPI0031B6A88A
MKKKTLYQKIFDKHVVYESVNELPLLYIDLHLIHEVTSPQAFEGLRLKNRIVRQPQKTFATMDHNVPTLHQNFNLIKKKSRLQMETLIKNCVDYNIPCYDISHPNQGIVHVMGPEQGMTLPGMTIVCGDSHTSTHGAFGTLSFGIGTSEVEHVFATQTLRQKRMKNMLINIIGKQNKKIFSKDIILGLIRTLGTSKGVGYVIEFNGSVIKQLSMESRMTICNMAVEMGAKSGLIPPDHITYSYLKNKNFIPKNYIWTDIIKKWNFLKSDVNVFFDQKICFDITTLLPQITWGTNPSQVISITEKIPKLKNFSTLSEQEDIKRSLEYMGLKNGQSLINLTFDKVFIGSCTNSRIEDLRIVATVVKNKKISNTLEAIIVPGSKLVKKQAEKEGLDKIFKNAGFQWRHPGCSMCLGMNDDYLKPYQRCASTSNRNFEGRQGSKGRTHLMSPWLAAHIALYGKLYSF